MSANIKVVVRPRPLDENKKEKWAPGFEVHGRRITLGAKTFDPDVTTSSTAGQNELYENCLPIIDSVKNGNNGTIMVYGQTGTGKTHTMMGSGTTMDGVAFQAMEDLIEYVRDEVLLGRKMSLTLAMLEIYNEKVSDMLTPTQPEVTLINGCPHQATRVTLASMEDATKYVNQGLSYRKVSSTAMNDRSSRSHVILSLDLAEVDENGKADVAHLFLVDLAGSENVKKSNVSGSVAKEAGNINRSLLALKTVILTLSNSNSANTGDNKPAHVPYRDSKLTLMLQDSIGGSARTMLIACVSPIGRDVEETKSTLEYASKARTIRNVSNTERDKLSTKLRGMELEIQRLRNKLEDKINEKNGYYVNRQEHDRTEEIQTELNQAKEDLETLRKVANDATANRHVMEGQLKMFKAMEEEARTELNEHKTQFTKALRQIEDAERMTRDYCRKALSDVESVWEDSNSKMTSELQGWHNNLQQGRYLEDYQPQIEEHCANIKTTCMETVSKFQSLHMELQSQLEESNQSDLKMLAEYEEEQMRAFKENHQRFAKYLQSSVAERRENVKNAGEMVQLYTEKCPDPSNGVGISHMMESLRTDMLETAKPLLTLRPKPEEVVNATNEFHMKMEAEIRRPAVEGLPHVSSMPPMAPVSNNSFGSTSRPSIFAAAAGGAGGLTERGDANSTSSGMVKQHPPKRSFSSVRNTTDSREELLKRRSRRDSRRDSVKN